MSETAEPDGSPRLVFRHPEWTPEQIEDFRARIAQAAADGAFIRRASVRPLTPPRTPGQVRRRRLARLARQWGAGPCAATAAGLLAGPPLARLIEPGWPWLWLAVALAVAILAEWALWLAIRRAAR